MRKMKRLLALLLALILLLLPAFSMAEEEDEAPVTHTARSTTRLKVRRAPSDDALGGDSIPADTMVYILEYGNYWCKIRTSYMEGYVKTQYLTDLVVVDPDAVAQQEEAREAQIVEVGELQPGFEMNQNNFEEKFFSHTVVSRAPMYEEPRENAPVVRYLEIYKQVLVGEISGDWCLVCYNGNTFGYMRVSHLFKWDRIDPYAGEIPGLELWSNLVFVNQSVDLYDIETNELLDTVNPGAAFSAGDKDAYGRYPVPYDRTTAYVTEDQVAYAMRVVPWEEAQPGDLISVMSTFFPVGISNAMIYGRNWNIHLSSDMISGTVLQPGQTFNMNEVIGPYLKATGYMSAPILSSDATSGYGGGTCQVNTTFYIATIQLPLLVTHRKVHQNVGMDYAEKGFDAAVGSGDINLTMENSLPYAIRYQFMNSDGVLTCCIFRE